MNYYTLENNQMKPASADIGQIPLNNIDQTLIKVFKPTRRTIFLRPSLARSGVMYNIPFPYIVFLIGSGKRFNVTLTLEPPTTDSIVYMPPLGNIYTSSLMRFTNIYGIEKYINIYESRVCLSMFNLKTIDRTLDNMIEYFWNSEFDRYSWETCANVDYDKLSKIPLENILNAEHWKRYPEHEVNTLGNLIKNASSIEEMLN